MEYIKKGIHHPFKKLSNLSVCQQMVKDVMCVYMYFIYILYIYIYIYYIGIYILCCAVLSHFSHVQLFVTLWTVACQAPQSKISAICNNMSEAGGYYVV